ncbi:hypothetical protein IDH44_03820 [Paenibacillus sp. IB182496]|uniref:Polysaccharide lyase 8 N-terminal alpha-helical domain-containing protein n=1 Tax=Paenibacillus sabuli TaxID=2772509 RepID=A0A927GQI2_9BACL|nr:hypothetical protein [Paenibacillus sabuli]MBD2844306.1 hypothetical protein [Paenibacillus sabuli]
MKVSQTKRSFGKVVVTLGLVMALLVASASLTHHNVSASSDAYDLLREAWKERLTGGAGYNASDPDIAQVIAAQDDLADDYYTSYHAPTPSESYLWADQSDGTIFEAEASYRRLLTMAHAYANPYSSISATTKAAMQDAIVEGMEFLIDEWYNASVSQNEQWFKFEIGVPKAIISLSVLMYDNLIQLGKSALIEDHMDAILHFSPDPADSRSATRTPRPGYMTGANLMDKCLNHILVGVLLKDGSLIDVANDRIVDIFDYTTSGDGFYKDGSFIQHNAVPYTGTYGLVLMSALPAYLSLLDGTEWELNDPNADHLYDWVYDSYEPVLVRGAIMDYVRGRAISRMKSQNLHSGRALLQALVEISTFAPPADAAYFKGIVKRWANTDIYDDFYSKESSFAQPSLIVRGTLD